MAYLDSFVPQTTTESEEEQQQTPTALKSELRNTSKFMWKRVLVSTGATSAYCGLW